MLIYFFKYTIYKHILIVFRIIDPEMEDIKRENNRVKRSKSDVKSVVAGYLQKRNYSTFQQFASTVEKQITLSLIEKDVGKSNSILYSCYNTDILAIDHNFTKFLIWLKDQTKHKHICQDIEKIVGPLFCHLYLDILRGGSPERASSFLNSHLPSIDKSNCDDMIKDLINLFGSDSELNGSKEKFRSKKVAVEITDQSFKMLKKFVLESCHVVFLQVLQKWFDFQISDDSESVEVMNKTAPVGAPKDLKFQYLLSAIEGLKKEQVPIYNISINCKKQDITCGLLKRQCGLVAFAEGNTLCLMPIHPFNSLHEGANNVIKLMNHSARIYSIDISPNKDVLVTGSADRSICIYNIAPMELIKKCTGHLAPVYCVKISGDGKFIVSGSIDNTCRLWHIGGKSLRIFAGHSQGVTCTAFHANCFYIATGSTDRTIRLWSVIKSSCIRLLHGAKGTVYSLAFSPCGKLLASASEDRKIRIWDLSSSKVIVDFRCKDSPITHLIWNSIGNEICAGTVEGVIRVWDYDRLQQNSDSNKYHEPVLIQSMNASLLSLEYTFGTYSTLTT